jgi:pimeloyl-ACP methyl ester carboxylesterase
MTIFSRRSLARPGAIDEQHYVPAGGVEQWVGIRGDDRANPVLLIVHGGPGSPYSIFTPLIREWERHFTVVQWDRRGVGRTRGRSGGDCGTLAQLVDDGVEVAEFLRAHLGAEKVVLLAGSMGTLIGTPLAKARPDLFSAYVATDFYATMLRNEAESYALALQRTPGDRRLTRIGGDPRRWTVKDWNAKMAAAMATDPVLPNGVTKLVMRLVLTDPTYSWRDVKNYLAGFESAKKQLFEQFMAYDAYAWGTDFAVPFFLFPGDQDVLTLTTLAREYFDAVTAPVKDFRLVQNAGHFAAFTQPDQFLGHLVDSVRPVVSA